MGTFAWALLCSAVWLEGCGFPRPADVADLDAAIDATTCFGTDLAKVCLASVPSQPLAVNAQTTIDTSDPATCGATTVGAKYCVIGATTISISAKLRGIGPRPLVLIATDSITVTLDGSIDVGSHRFTGIGIPQTGAGADPPTCAAGTPPSNAGGGAGGSFAGAGGNGGNGVNAGTGGGRPGAAVALPLTELRGGCPGQDGHSASGNQGVGGHGGGAIFLIAGTKIEIKGPINATGGGGGGGGEDSGGNQYIAGGGGGGAGGMIGFDAPAVICNNLLLASGGAGGEASGAGAGQPGADPTSTGVAVGGHGNANGGDGGAGSSASIAASGSTGGDGYTGGIGGGGGGGGGAGVIRAPASAMLGPYLSPPVTP
ncbi:MAG: hypothetical protein E6J91_13085 [Deltaproteobacteria bacterium]|nr:MAG: hypothetical protein E6J91_13085 [Deltaproteobacteria bacterium]